MTMGAKIKQLRSKKGLSQEKLAEKLNVSRSAVAKWEAGDAIPELEKLLEICDFFSCNLDELVRKSLSENECIYSEVKVQTVKPFKMARYVMISPESAPVFNCQKNVYTVSQDTSSSTGMRG